MADVVVKTLDEIPPYRGPNAVEGIRVHPAGRTLGVSAWGMNVLSIEAGCENYPEHDHEIDGQEEVYVVLEGSGEIIVGSERHNISQGAMVRVSPRMKRKIVPGSKGLVVLAIGATPGAAYKPPRAG